jgi:hypothetical protein
MSSPIIPAAAFEPFVTPLTPPAGVSGPLMVTVPVKVGAAVGALEVSLG